MSPNFKQTHDSAAENKPFQHYDHSGICTNIQLWWQWSWWVIQGTIVSSWSNIKAGHSGCSRWLERESWRRCTRRLWITLYVSCYISRDICMFILRVGKILGNLSNSYPHCNLETSDRGLKLLDFATYNSLVLANTLGNHKPSRRWTWHSPDRTHHNQIDYILVKKRFRSGIKTARARTFLGADVGSDHDMVMMTFQTRLKNSRKPTQPRISFDL